MEDLTCLLAAVRTLNTYFTANLHLRVAYVESIFKLSDLKYLFCTDFGWGSENGFSHISAHVGGCQISMLKNKIKYDSCIWNRY